MSSSVENTANTPHMLYPRTISARRFWGEEEANAKMSQEGKCGFPWSQISVVKLWVMKTETLHFWVTHKGHHPVRPASHRGLSAQVRTQAGLLGRQAGFGVWQGSVREQRRILHLESLLSSEQSQSLFLVTHGWFSLISRNLWSINCYLSQSRKLRCGL